MSDIQYTEALNLGRRLFIDSNGDTFPIVATFDEDGEECELGAAVAAVAGTEGKWFAIDLRDFLGVNAS